MATRYSAEAQLYQSVAYSQVHAKDYRGKVRQIFFTRGTTDATNGSVAATDVIDCGPLVKGMRVVGGRVCTDGLGTSVTIGVGYTGAATAFGSALDVAAAGAVTIADTLAKGFGTEIASDNLRLIITVSNNTVTADKTIKGHLLLADD